MSQWRVLPGDPVAAEHFRDLDAVFTFEGTVVANDPMSRVTRVCIDGRVYFIKCYFGLGKKHIRRWFTTPRVQLEWENLLHFADWGIPTAQVVAYGLEREGGRFLRGALITAEIRNTTDLRRLARNGDPRMKSRQWLNGVSLQLADIARRMHCRRFVHGDLKWRNLLVDDNDRLYLIDCPSGGFWWPPFLEYRIVKDLACLDKFAKRTLSRSRRLRFYLDYVQKKTLDADDRRRICKVIDFFAGRDDDLATASSLRAAGRTPMLHQSLALDNGQLLTMLRWLRILPGKRLTGIGEWQGDKVIVKLFISARSSERHWQRECMGIETLNAHGLPTPKLLASGPLKEGGHFVLTNYLEGAHSPDVDSPGELALAFAQVGRMHALGILQEDAHLANFLLQQDMLHIIDGEAIRPPRAEDDFIENLGLLFAQLPAATDAVLRTKLLAAYRTERGNIAIDEARLSAAVIRARQARLHDYLDKCLRDCSLFKVAKRTDLFFSVVRSEAKLLAPLLHDPDAWLEKGIPLKRGGTSALSMVELDGRQLVIKRYNIKSPGHALSRCWRPSRAWHAWVEGNRLQFLGIPTPRPLALVERRIGPFRGKAWLITEYCNGETVRRYFSTKLNTPPAAEVAAIGKLFAQLTALRICHGDLKASNLLWSDGRFSLVDLDATEQYDSSIAFARAWRRDRERLLRNWPVTSLLHAALDAQLPPLGL